MRKSQYLPAIGAVLGALLFPFLSGSSPEAVWDLLRRGRTNQMAQFCFVSFLGALLGAVGFLILSVLINRMSQGVPQADGDQSVPKPLRGWLLLPAVWFTLSPALHLVSILHHSVIVTHYSPKFILALDIANSALLFLLASAICFHLFARSKTTLVFVTTYFLAGLAYAVVRPVLALALGVPKSLLIQLTLFLDPPWFLLIVLWGALALSWVIYCRRADRVRVAFTEE